MHRALVLAVGLVACADPVDPGQIARDEPPPPAVIAAPPPTFVDPPPQAATRTRLRETRSLGYAGDAPLTQLPKRPSMFDERARTNAPVVVGAPPPVWGYGGAPYAYGGGGGGGAARGAPAPAQPIAGSNLVWSPQITSTGSGSAGGASAPAATPAVSPLAPK